MKRCLLLFLFAFLAAAPLMRAEVLVYTGTMRRTEPEKSYLTRTWKCFVVSNPSTGEVSVISYGRLDGLKRRDVGEVLTTDYYPLPRLDDSVFDLYSFTLLDNSVGVEKESLFLRGAQATVTVNRQSGTPVQAQRAKTLKGPQRRLGIGFGYSYLEKEILVKFNEARTVDANVRNVTVTQVRTELENYLNSLGYNP